MKSILFPLLILLFACASFAQQADNHPRPLTVGYDRFAPNRHAIWFGNNGLVANTPTADTAGWEWPAGSGKTVGFETGLIWGGRVAGATRVGGSTYRHGLQPGTLDAGGNAGNPQDPRFRIYHIRREDATTGTNPDYNNWPAADGAPVDGNGKPYFYGDEQLWFVSNDKDGALTSNLYGSPPIGLEVQTTVWGFSENPLLADVIFVKNLIVNESGSSFDQAYIGLWADMDLGYPLDDLAGVDTLLGLEYAYNKAGSDPVYGIPPAAGLMFLETPTVPSTGDTALSQGIPRPGFRYSPLSGFSFYVDGSGIFLDPTMGSPSGTVQLYNNMMGRLWNGQPVIDPVSQQAVKFPLAGDPLLARGWLDGTGSAYGFPLIAGDRRILLSAGPFTIAAGDTQEVVYAMLAKQGGDRIASVKLLKEYAEYVRFFYRRSRQATTPPRFEVAVSFPAPGSVSLTFEAVDSVALGGTAVILRTDGSLMAEIPLFDDGNHGDGAAGDHRFGASWSSPVQREGIDAYFDLAYPGPMKHRWFGRRCVPLAGGVKITGAHIEADNLNRDFQANPGENLRISLDVTNASSLALEDIDCIPLDGSTPGESIYRIFAPFPAGATVRRSYADTDSGRYASIDIPVTAAPGTDYPIPFLINDNRGNSWFDTAAVRIYPLPFPPIDSLALHVAGVGEGTLGWRIVHPGEWKGHAYRVTVQDKNVSERLVSVYDSTDRIMRAENIPLPDNFAHDFPIIDGFQVTQGTALRPIPNPDDSTMLVVPPLKKSYEPPQNGWLVPVSGYDWIPGSDFFGSELTASDLIPVKLVFSSTEQQHGYAYLRGGTPNYGYTGWGTVPFRAFDVSDSLHPRQISVGFIEQNGSQFKDLQWLPGLSSTDREFLFIFKSDYTATPESSYMQKQLNADGVTTDILYGGWFTRKQSTDLYHDGDIQWIIPTVPISKSDTFIVRILRKISSGGGPSAPAGLAIEANYPNPFSQGTTIRFTLPQSGRARLFILDQLGRLVATLADEEKAAGEHAVAFHPARLRMPAGVYCCVLTAEGGTRMRMMLYLK